MTTPLEIRQWKRDAQRSFRLVFNQVASGIDRWKTTVLEGKEIITELTNMMIESSRIGDACKGMPDGTQLLLRKRVAFKMQKALRAFETVLRTLEALYDNMMNGLKEFQQLVEPLSCSDGEQEESWGDPRSDVPMCQELTHRTVCRVLNRIVAMYARELRVKDSIFVDYKSAVFNAGDGFHSEQNEEYWQVHISAWMTHVFVDFDDVKNTMVGLARDAGMPYSSV